MKEFKTDSIEEFLGDFVCESRFPVLYYAVKEGLCGDAYGFLIKLQELRDDGVITQEVLRTLITEGPLHPAGRGENERYNVMDLFDGNLPGRSGGAR